MILKHQRNNKYQHNKHVLNVARKQAPGGDQEVDPRTAQFAQKVIFPFIRKMEEDCVPLSPKNLRAVLKQARDARVLRRDQYLAAKTYAYTLIKEFKRVTRIQLSGYRKSQPLFSPQQDTVLCSSVK